MCSYKSAAYTFHDLNEITSNKGQAKYASSVAFGKHHQITYGKQTDNWMAALAKCRLVACLV